MRRKFIRIFIALLVLIAFPLLAWRMYLARVINKQLANIRAAGLPTDGEELNRWYPVVPDNQNAALVLTQAFALLKTINTASDERLEAAWKLKDKFPRLVDGLTSEQVGWIRWYVATNQQAVAKTSEAMKLPLSRYPIDCSRLMSTELPHLAHLVNLAYLNQCSAALAILDGRKDAPMENIKDILALAHTLDCEPLLISQLVRLRMVRLALATLEQRANAGTFTSVELVNLKALIGERAMTIPYFRMGKRDALRIHPPKDENDTKQDSPLPCYGPAILRLIGYYELDYGSYLIGMSKAIALLSNSPPTNLRVAGYFSHVGEESTKRRRTLSGQTMSTYAYVPMHENEGIARQHLALAALAVERFRNETGRLPENIEELVPKFIEAMPEDPFTGLELEYSRTEKGYLIYSVGRDREDNGGLEQVDKRQSDDKKSYDITFTVDR
jgi:hypothetical protein